ncbi:MAG: hypothetical protein ACRDHX_16745 [Chloroflexota bacterium]
MHTSNLEPLHLRGSVISVDHDADTITVKLDEGEERTLPFDAFDAGDVYNAGQHFDLTVDEAGQPLTVIATAEPERHSIPGYVESVDVDDELAWVYLREPEGWRRKVMPLHLFVEHGLAAAGRHFTLEVDEAGTPIALHADESDLEMQLQPAEAAKPRWTQRPAAEAD